MSAHNTTSPSDLLTGRLPILCLVTDLRLAGGDELALYDIVSAAVRGGVNMVQLRAPDADERQYRALARIVWVAVNERALIIGNVGRRSIPDTTFPVDGLHFPEAEKHAVRLVRQRPPYSNTLVGCSAHSLESVADATKLGADYVIVGTVFPSETHPGSATQGLQLVRNAVDATDKPIIAIGGIDATNAASAITAGASGVAVIRSIAIADDPKQAAADLMHQIQSAWSQRN